MDDDEKPQQEVEMEPQLMDDYIGGPHDVSTVIQYHIRVATSMSDGVWRGNLKLVNNGKKLQVIYNVNAEKMQER